MNKGLQKSLVLLEFLGAYRKPMRTLGKVLKVLNLEEYLFLFFFGGWGGGWGGGQWIAYTFAKSHSIIFPLRYSSLTLDIIMFF